MRSKLHHAPTTILQAAPLVPVAVGLALGIVLDEPLRPTLTIYFLGFSVANLLFLVRVARTKLAPLLITIAALCVGGAMQLSTARTISPTSIERHATDEARVARVRGVVVLTPRILKSPPGPFRRWRYRSERTAFLLDVQTIRGPAGDIQTSGRIRVTINEAVLDLRANETIEVFGMLRAVPPSGTVFNPGSFDWSGYRRRQGIVATMRCGHRENVRRFDREGTSFGAMIDTIRTKIRGLLTDDIATSEDGNAGLLEAMILGHRSQLDRRLSEVFIASGSAHFLAVSGIHVLIVMSFARALCWIFVCRHRTTTLVMLLTVLLYAGLAEPRPPILRAGVIAVLYCIARLLGRERAFLNWLSAAAILLLAIDPRTLFDIGFQLSFGAVLGVAYLTHALPQAVSAVARTMRRQRGARVDIDMDALALDLASPAEATAIQVTRYVRRYVFTSVAVSVGAWAATWPIVAQHFHQLHALGWISSLVLFPFVAMVMGIGFIKLGLGVLSPPLGAMTAPILQSADSLLVRVAERLATMPGANVSVSAPPWWFHAAYYAFLAALVWWHRSTTRLEHRSRLPNEPRTSVRAVPPDPARFPTPMNCDTRTECVMARRIVMVATTILLGCSVTWCWPTAPQERLSVTVLSVGAGLATVIELPNGETVLYDAGTSQPYDVARSTVLPYLEHRGIDRIDRIYVSHPNLDHFSAVPSITAQIETGHVVLNDAFARLSRGHGASEHFLSLLKSSGQRIETHDVQTTWWEVDGVTFEWLWPTKQLPEEISANNSSTVLRVSYEGHSVLLTGDIEDYAQRALLKRGDLHADVLVLPHHGSVRSSTQAFIEAVAPDALIRPSSESMSRTFNGLTELVGDIPLYNTADVGAVRVDIDKAGLRISAAKIPKN